MSKKEIERKWRIPKIPEDLTKQAELIKQEEICQAYPLDEDIDFRVRETSKRAGKQKNYSLAIKDDGLLIRREKDIKVEQWIYELLFKVAKSRILYKTRLVYKLNGYLFEINIFHKRHQGLIILEIEFKNASQAESFKLPSFFKKAKEVTNKPLYKNYNLAKINYTPG